MRALVRQLGPGTYARRPVRIPIIRKMLMLLATMSAWLRARATNDRGAALVEYALLVAFVAIVCIGTLLLLGTRIAGQLENTGASIN